MRNPLIAVPIQESNLKKIEVILKKKLPRVDAFEIWLDCLHRKYQKPEIIENLTAKWKNLSKKILILVCKDGAEQGRFSGYARHKVDLLLAASRGGADFVDIGLHSGRKQIHKLRSSLKKTRLIISWHDFLKTPKFFRLEKIAKIMIDLGADVVKIATQVESVLENENLMKLALDLQKIHQKHIIIGMGTLGVATRVFSRQLGNEINFVALYAETAPGQLTLEEALSFQKVLK